MQIDDRFASNPEGRRLIFLISPFSSDSYRKGYLSEKSIAARYIFAAVMLLLPLLIHAQNDAPYSGLDLLHDPTRVRPDFNKERPIEAKESVFMNEMTWLEIRDAIRSGKTTAIVMTGGLEMSGPYAVTDKHNIICRVAGKRIAERLGNALIATIVPYVPQGSIDPPTGYVPYPGTISVREETFMFLLTDILASLRAQGFERIILLGDSGGNQKGMEKVASKLDAKWRDTEILYIPEYFGYEKWIQWGEEKGVHEVSEGIHDIFRDTVIMMLDDTEHVRYLARKKVGLVSINGVPLEPLENVLGIAKELVDYQVSITVKAIQQRSKMKN